MVIVKWLLFDAYIYITNYDLYGKGSYISTEGSIVSYDGIALNKTHYTWLVCIKSTVQWSFQILHH